MSTFSAIYDLSLQLLAKVPVSAESARGDMDQAAQFCEKVRSPIARLAGVTGFSSLLSRALALAKRRVPSLDAVRVEPDGSLSGLEKLDSGSDLPGALPNRGAVLVTELLGLLILFIGESLTLGILREAFPDGSLETLISPTEEPS